MVNLMEIKPVYCPICKKQARHSDYLEEVFEDNLHAYWFACLVTHYRHEHINYYDRTWQSPGYKAKNPEARNSTHVDFKMIVNNRAKRKIMRAIIKDKNLSSRVKKLLFLGSKELQHDDQKTTKLRDNLLTKVNKYKVIYQGEKL